MAHQVWLKPNRRVLGIAMATVAVVALIGLTLGLATQGTTRWIGAGLLILAVIVEFVLMVQCLRPRLAVRGNDLLVYLRFGRPEIVPLAIVECIFLGRPELQSIAGQSQRMVCLVLRLAESAVDYKQRNVQPTLGHWEDGYITIQGAWCEPLTLPLAEGLNERLRTAQRQVT